jgi:hypothetical protein
MRSVMRMAGVSDAAHVRGYTADCRRCATTTASVPLVMHVSVGAARRLRAAFDMTR